MLRLARVDFDRSAHRPPSVWRLLAALAVSVAGSLGADALLVRLGMLDPAQAGAIEAVLRPPVKNVVGRTVGELRPVAAAFQ